MDCSAHPFIHPDVGLCAVITLLIFLSVAVAFLLVQLRALSLAVDSLVGAAAVTGNHGAFHPPAQSARLDDARAVEVSIMASAADTRCAKDNEHADDCASRTIPLERNVPLEVFDGIVNFCPPEDFCRLALACRPLGSLILARRLRRIVIAEERYFDFREWLYQVAMVQLITRSALQTPVPGLNITVPISPSLQEQFNRHMRELVFPDHWSQASASFVKVVAALRPNAVETVVFGSDNSVRGWYQDLSAIWEPTTMDGLLSAVKTLVFIAPTQGGLHFVLTRQPSPGGPLVYEFIQTIRILPSFQVPSAWDSDDGNWSAVGFGTPATISTDVQLAVAAQVMHLSLLTGIRSHLAQLAFPYLRHLHIFFQDWCQLELPLVDRLVSEAAPSLVALKFTSNASSSVDGLLCPRETLASLSTVTVDWAVLSYLGLLETYTLSHSVTVIVDNYVGNLASDEQYEQASNVLRSTHWAKISFIDSPSRDMLQHDNLLQQRRAHLQQAIGVFDISFV